MYGKLLGALFAAGPAAHACCVVLTLSQPHPNGVAAMDISPDAMFLVTLSYAEDEEHEQFISLWEWTVERDGPLYTSTVEVGNVQAAVKFNPSDIREVVTTGTQRVVFWSWHAKKFKFYSPPVSQRDFRQNVGVFTMTMFLPGTTQAVTATTDGDVLLWDQNMVSDHANATDRSAVKVVRISHKGGIQYLAVCGKLLVTGSDDGAVRFFDFGFRLVSWFEDMNAGPVTSVSFALDDLKPMDEEAFSVPDFLCGTTHGLIVGMQASMFEELSAEQRRGTLIVQGMDDEVHGMHAHPFLAQMAVAAYSGSVQVWDYLERTLLVVRRFDASRLRPQTVTFDPLGRFLAIGFTNGAIKFVTADRLEDTQPVVRNSQGAVTDIRFSADGSYVATADADRCVALYRYMRAPLRRTGFNATGEAEADETVKEVEQWVYLGKNRAHSRPITGLEFGVDGDGQPLLVSCGEDRRVVEYDVTGSSVAKGLVTKGQRVRVEQTATPTACMWHPPVEHSRENLLVTASDEYKLKLWNATNKACRRTVLGPTYGGPINRLMRLPQPQSRTDVAGEEVGAQMPECVVYSTAEKVVGLIMLPLDGNVDASMGLIAHPREVSAISTSHDGRYLLTAGGSDGVVNMWTVDTRGLQSMAAEGRSGDGMEPFLNLLDGGRGGAFYEEIADYFYYAQLRSQGEDSTSPRRTSGRVPLAELPNLMRALGFYPTELEIENMCSEIRYSSFTATGQTKEELDLNDLIRLYVNHRPVLGIGKAQIDAALTLIKDATQSGPDVEWETLSHLLKTKAEGLSDQELLTCVNALVGDEDISGPMSAGRLAHDVLGFEDYGAAAAEADGDDWVA